jgi:hypothetical protein
MGLRHGVRVRTELRWFGIGTTGGLLWTRKWNFGFYKWRGISWPIKPPSASQGFSSTDCEYVYMIVNYFCVKRCYSSVIFLLAEDSLRSLWPSVEMRFSVMWILTQPKWMLTSTRRDYALRAVLLVDSPSRSTRLLHCNGVPCFLFSSACKFSTTIRFHTREWKETQRMRRKSSKRTTYLFCFSKENFNQTKPFSKKHYYNDVYWVI